MLQVVTCVAIAAMLDTVSVLVLGGKHQQKVYTEKEDK
jgi:hypothetical protein